jgi:hypothetical protein
MALINAQLPLGRFLLSSATVSVESFVYIPESFMARGLVSESKGDEQVVFDGLAQKEQNVSFDGSYR